MVINDVKTLISLSALKLHSQSLHYLDCETKLKRLITNFLPAALAAGHGMGWNVVLLLLVLLGTFSFWSDFLNFQI